jgi:hypothetical protein
MNLFLILALLQIKHWYIDFVNQTEAEVKGKATYGNWEGLGHSIKHGVMTTIIFSFFYTLEIAFILGLIDFVTHYHIDWVKMNWGSRDIRTPAFWNHLGLDQMAHQLVYIGLICLLVI